MNTYPDDILDQASNIPPINPSLLPLAVESASASHVFPAYALYSHTSGESMAYIPDTDVPGTWDVMASTTSSTYYAGDFKSGDLSRLYVLDYTTNELHSLDTTTVADTVVCNFSGTPDSIRISADLLFGTIEPYPTTKMPIDLSAEKDLPEEPDAAPIKAKKKKKGNVWQGKC